MHDLLIAIDTQLKGKSDALRSEIIALRDSITAMVSLHERAAIIETKNNQ